MTCYPIRVGAPVSRSEPKQMAGDDASAALVALVEQLEQMILERRVPN